MPKKKKKVAPAGEVVGEALRGSDGVSVVARIKDAGGWGVKSWGADECAGGAQTAEVGQAEEEE